MSAVTGGDVDVNMTLDEERTNIDTLTTGAMIH